MKATELDRLRSLICSLGLTLGDVTDDQTQFRSKLLLQVAEELSRLDEEFGQSDQESLWRDLNEVLKVRRYNILCSGVRSLRFEPEFSDRRIIEFVAVIEEERICSANTAAGEMRS